MSVGYDDKTVVSSVDLTLEPGSITVLAGPNGCGKSTLLRTVARQLAPIAGSLKLDDKDVKDWSPQEFAQKVAFVPQSLSLLHQMTVEELVSLGRNPHQRWWSWSQSAHDKTAVNEALARTDLLHLRDRLFATLSGGERQRAMIATALAQEPAFILLDEPVNHLDFKHQLSIVSLIKELKQKGIGALVVLHDLNLIWRLADQVMLLKQTSGATETLVKGSADAVLTEEHIAHVFEVRMSIHQLNDGDKFFQLIEPTN
ncbi:MAG: ABC transporter ATP-binding protein [Cyanobacteria bacterium]|nr:ABC transporter ATP-binding protein [Cyanobacteriota bacterium]